MLEVALLALLVGVTSAAVAYAIEPPRPVIVAEPLVRPYSREAPLAAVVPGPGIAEAAVWVSPRMLRRIIGDTRRVGVAVVDAAGVILHAEGGAIGEVGLSPADLIGQTIAPKWALLGLEPALRGRTVAFVEPEPVVGGRLHTVTYVPRRDGAGEVVGAVVWWVLHDLEEVDHA